MTSSIHLKFYCYFFLLALLVVASASQELAPTPSMPPTPPPMDSGGWDGGDYTSYPWTPPPPAAPCNSDDKSILLQIKKDFNNSDIFDSWVPDTDCCNGWDFVGCDPYTGRVSTFIFMGNLPWGRKDLPTIFPRIIGNLTRLTKLLYKNNSTGRIPSTLANLKRLTYLDLSYNRLSGHIPKFIVNLKDLALLALENNQLSGKIPNQLSQLPNLNFISIFNNRLKGRIPDSLFSQLKVKDGVTLLLSSNKLTGTIPKSFANIKFGRLDLNNNRLVGDASFIFGKDRGSLYIDLSNNKFSFNMTNVEVAPEIFTLYLNNNYLYGNLNPSLTAARLFNFNVSVNLLCGPIPVGGSGALQEFGASAYAGNKCLCGDPLPPCV